MDKYNKRINIQKKYKDFPSTQSSGMPIKSISNISKLNKNITNNNQMINPLIGRPSVGTSVIPEYNNSDNVSGLVNPFYIYLLNNSITRTTIPINETASVGVIYIVNTTIDNLLKRGDTFYIYNPKNFKSILLTCALDLVTTSPIIRIISQQFYKGQDNFPSGSFIIKNTKLESFKFVNAPIGSGSATYLLYLNSLNTWYSSSALNLSLGTIIGSESSTTMLRACEYIAPAEARVMSVTLAFYSSVTADLEFRIYKVPLVDDSTASVTPALMTSTPINGSYTANKNYVKNIDITSNANSLLTAGQGVAILARRTSGSTARIYGRGFIKLNLT